MRCRRAVKGDEQMANESGFMPQNQGARPFSSSSTARKAWWSNWMPAVCSSRVTATSPRARTAPPRCTLALRRATLITSSTTLGTPQVLTDKSGKIVWQGRALAFGETTEVVNVVDNPLRFAGQYYDSETGLHYNYFRYCDAEVGRYVMSDPIGLRGGINTYNYVGNKPVVFIDIKGLFSLYGNWCGPNWTGGMVGPYDVALSKKYIDPIDTLDNCCKIHDIAYSNCRNAFACDGNSRKKCQTKANRALGF